MTSHRIVILSDIHGILASLNTALGEILRDPPDEIIVSGDFVGGPQSHETLTRLRELNCHFILGNGEIRMLQMHNRTAPEAWWTYRQFDLGRFIFNQLTEDDLTFISTLPEQLHLKFNGADPIRVVHATPWSTSQLMYPDRDPDLLQRALDAIEEQVLILGHIHQPGIYRVNGKLAVNAGALSNNLMGRSQISYASLEWEGDAWQPTIHTLQPDYEAIKSSFVETGFYEAAYPFSRAFWESIQTGEDTPYFLIESAFNRAKAASLAEIDFVPDEHWLAAGEEFPWKLDF
ncbi:metallophosphoesterase family protein [Chloroflexota bacterium]|nr:metallophosphoesterase family protein [Chloroflexota bacterium]